MKKFWKNVYTIMLLILCIAAFVCVLAGAKDKIALSVCGGLASFLCAPFFHEMGHALAAKWNNFSVVYVKVCFFEWDGTGEKHRFSLTNPFCADETKAIPKTAGNMKKRAAAYTIGGLLFSVIYLLLLIVVTACTVAVGGAAKNVSYICLGALPYGLYLFFLNVVPFQYGGGKTDGLIFREIVDDMTCGVRFVAALNAQGLLYEGKSYAEIDREYLYALPIVAEDEPLFIANLFNLYYAEIEKGNLENAAHYLNRIATLSPYLTAQEERLALAELLYANSLAGDNEQAEKCFLALGGDSIDTTAQEATTRKGNQPLLAVVVAEKRAFAAYYRLLNDTAKGKKWIDEGLLLARKISIAGERKTEEILITRLQESDAKDAE